MKSLFIEPLLTESEAARLTTPSEIAWAQTLCPESRRREFLTWRAIVRRELGADVQIAYSDIGAPVVENRDVYIGVSHSGGRVAVCISDAPCAVDLERMDRDVSVVLPRYRTEAERMLCSDPLWPVVLCSAKETLYKYAGRKGLDLRRDLHVETADLAAGRLTGRIENGEPVGLSVSLYDGFVVVAIL